MTSGNAWRKKIIAIVLSIALAAVGLLSIVFIERLQGNARVINYAGVVRGATQRLIKQEMQGMNNDALMRRLDAIIEELKTGEGELGLIRLNDEAFQQLMLEMEGEWAELKTEILHVRQGADDQRLFDLSEKYFDLADRTVSEAEAYSARNARIVKICFLILASVFMLVAVFLIWLSSIQNKREKALEKAQNENEKRSEHLTQMTKALQAPINEISELIYVSDVETYELLFINEAGKKTFHLDEVNGQMCYKALQGMDSPCPFCTNAKLKPGENYSWETTNPLTKRHYMLKDRLVEWDGRKARLEIAFDMTQVEQEKQKLKYALDTENMVMECIRILYQGRDLENDIHRMLEQVTTFLGAERAYIFSFHSDSGSNDYEWCAPGVAPQKENLQAVPMSAFGRWIPTFEKQECVVIEDVEDYRVSDPEEYQTLAVQGINSLVVAPLERDGKLTGCLGVDNPPKDKLWNIASLLQTLCYFMMLAFRRAENEQQLSHLSFYDTLTSFYNRNRFIKDLDSLADENASVGIVYLDVNGLKAVNDKQGHASGDQLLIEAAGKIKAVFRQSDCYRVGGDEFVVICLNITQDRFEEKVTQLKQSFAFDARCKAAIGTHWAESFQNPNQIVADADAKMYEDKKEFYRKNKAANRYRYHSDDVLQLADPNILREEINRERFVVYLQPKVSSSNRTAVGAEALIRYQSSDGALVLPGNFLPLLEEAKTISQIDFYVFELVCSKIDSWFKEGKNGFPVAINFSRYSLIQPHFIERLVEICRKYGISPTCLEIEITESVREVDGIDISRLVTELRRKGFAVTIDDFGTDYANLALLTAVEFDVLKLDKSMVQDVASNAKTQDMITSIVDSCKKMGIQLVAEGIEQEEQLGALRACGVELVQGFLFSKPIPIEEYESRYL